MSLNDSYSNSDSSSNKAIHLDFHLLLESPILKDTNNITQYYYKSYQDYYNIILIVKDDPGREDNQTQITDDDARLYWLQNAIEINSNNAVQNPNDPAGQSNTYIRAVTRYG